MHYLESGKLMLQKKAFFYTIHMKISIYNVSVSSFVYLIRQYFNCCSVYFHLPLLFTVVLAWIKHVPLLCIIHFLINYVIVLQIKRLQTQQVSKGQVCSNTHAPAHADLPEKDRCPYSAPVNRQCVKTFKVAHLTSPPCLSPYPELFIFCP